MYSPKIGKGWYYEDYEGVIFKVLGGPNPICGEDYYTVRIMENAHAWNQQGRQWNNGDVTTSSYFYIRDSCELVTTVVSYTHPDVIESHCPECDEPEMIFYSGDYICAWCREHLEDGIR